MEPEYEKISLKRQTELIGISRSTYYYQLIEKRGERKLKEEIQKIYSAYPFYGARKIAKVLQKEGYHIGRKRTERIKKEMNLETIYPKPKTSTSNNQHKKYPYLLDGLEIMRPNQVWATDITYIKTEKGWVYLVAIIDWYSRYIVAWRVSISMEKEFCIEALIESLHNGTPDIFNSDQGVQYTSNEFTNLLQSNKIAISMDGQGRAFDNIFTERFWRSLKYEEVFLKSYQNVKETYKNVKNYITFYNEERLHQALNYKTPLEVYTGQYQPKPIQIKRKYMKIETSKPKSILDHISN